MDARDKRGHDESNIEQFGITSAECAKSPAAHNDATVSHRSQQNVCSGCMLDVRT
jgi:hypothetical protein